MSYEGQTGEASWLPSCSWQGHGADGPMDGWWQPRGLWAVRAATAGLRSSEVLRAEGLGEGTVVLPAHSWEPWAADGTLGSWRLWAL